MQMLTMKQTKSMTMKMTFIGSHHPCALPPLFLPSFLGFFFSFAGRCSLFAITVSPFDLPCWRAWYRVLYRVRQRRASCPAACFIAVPGSFMAPEIKAPQALQKPGWFRENLAAP